MARPLCRPAALNAHVWVVLGHLVLHKDSTMSLSLSLVEQQLYDATYYTIMCKIVFLDPTRRELCHDTNTDNKQRIETQSMGGGSWFSEILVVIQSSWEQ